jgi:hypothetical protein
METGLAADDGGFEVLAGGERIGSRRLSGPGDAALLTELGRRYVRAVPHVPCRYSPRGDREPEVSFSS